MRRLLSDPIFEAAGNAPMRSCDHPGCIGGGDFRAPKSRLDLHDYHWFCLEHVRAYNSAWNYYAGMSDAEIEAKPVIIVQIEPGFGRTEITAADAAGVVARPHRRVGRGLENRIGQKTPHRGSVWAGRRRLARTRRVARTGSSAKQSRVAAGASAECRLKLGGRIRPVTKLRPGISPAQNGGARLARQAIEGGGTPVLFGPGGPIEPRHRLGFPGDSDAAVEQPGEPGPADRCNFDDRVAPISVAASRGDDEGAEDGGSRPPRSQPGHPAACQLPPCAPARQAGGFGSFVMVLS